MIDLRRLYYVPATGGTTHSATVAESSTATETPAALLTTDAATAEAASAADTLVAILTAAAATAENASASDTTGAVLTTEAATAETASAVDSPAAQCDAIATAAESATATDALLAWLSAYARPISDTDAVGWTPSSGGDLYAMIDESTYSDTDYIYTQTPNADAEVALTSMSDPGVSYGHVARYRARAENGGQVKVGVYEGAVLVQEWTDTLTADFATFEHAVTNEVTDYAALRLRFTALEAT